MQITSKHLIRSSSLGNPYGDDEAMNAMGPVPSAQKSLDFGKPIGFDDPSEDGVMLVKMRKGQELKIRCIARKVRVALDTLIIAKLFHLADSMKPTNALVHFRALQRSTQNGHPSLQSASSTIHTTPFDTRPTGTSSMPRPSGRCRRTQEKKKHRQVGHPLITIARRTGSTLMSRPWGACRPWKWWKR